MKYFTLATLTDNGRGDVMAYIISLYPLLYLLLYLLNETTWNTGHAYNCDRVFDEGRQIPDAIADSLMLNNAPQ